MAIASPNELRANRDIRRLLLNIAIGEAEAIQLWVKRTQAARCVYCGAATEEVDHLIPRTVIPNPDHKDYVPVVPSCRRCNRSLGCLVDPRIYGRIEHLESLLVYDEYTPQQQKWMAAGGAMFWKGANASVIGPPLWLLDGDQ